MLVIFLVHVRISPLPYTFSQADVGPFVPQRFEPPADAYGNQAHGVRQIAEAEIGELLFSRKSCVVSEAREKQEDLLALKVEAALASGLKVSAKEDVSA